MLTNEKLFVNKKLVSNPNKSDVTTEVWKSNYFNAELLYEVEYVQRIAQLPDTIGDKVVDYLVLNLMWHSSRKSKVGKSRATHALSYKIITVALG